jgi:hypothetical protein
MGVGFSQRITSDWAAGLGRSKAFADGAGAQGLVVTLSRRTPMAAIRQQKCK